MKTTLIILIAILASCGKESKRAYVIAKTDDNNWTTSARIECDSVDMVSEKHAIYWVDGSKFNLFAKSYIKIENNPNYKTQ
jgi:hypothetical protein